MLHYVFWLALPASCVLLRFVPSIPIWLFALMLAFSYAVGIAALVQEARHPSPESTGTAAAVSLALLLGTVPIFLMFLALITGIFEIFDFIFITAGALLALLPAYALLCKQFRWLPTLPAALLELIFLDNERK